MKLAIVLLFGLMTLGISSWAQGNANCIENTVLTCEDGYLYAHGSNGKFWLLFAVGFQAECLESLKTSACVNGNSLVCSGGHLYSVGREGKFWYQNSVGTQRKCLESLAGAR